MTSRSGNTASVVDTPIREIGRDLLLLLEETLSLPKDEAGVTMLIGVFVYDDIVDSTLGTPQQGYPKELALQMVERLRESHEKVYQWMAAVYQDLIEGVYPGQPLYPQLVMHTFREGLRETATERVWKLSDKVFDAMNAHRALRTGQPFFMILDFESSDPGLQGV